MPELPEVETIRRGLEQLLLGREFAGVEVFYHGSLKSPSVEELQQKLPGRRVAGIERRGKYLLLNLHDGTILVIHLRMTGKLVFSRVAASGQKHLHLIFSFADGSCLAFSDIRKFGTIWWLPKECLVELKGISSLGPEPLSADFHFPYLDRELEKRTVNIKALLLNQQFLAGLGNIYVDEILHRACVLPGRSSRSLTRTERLALFAAIRSVLEEAIVKRGTTVSDYRDAAGSAGSFQEELQVYGRRNQPCRRCGQTIERKVVAGRGTHFCPLCQR
ncbi:MAG: DNA-formamidopyrimidine glycosylase [Dethiobacter sp.]|jgi:formamidopyrimidine-DNA glycosylase|nr:DNA-formamidopyrimidine glycosylase [Dethiobacter sp.]MBS3897902.1 DNA-formamidopyrimidine glycosylase [Dethiobacter sp.]MBS3982166.1 DNA-formamidopyrimidine glycosylase [Dethiobacter sp.]MCL4463029.1 DNA-formamidopyrimidine glycosylase [Bacillota bacterium]MCL5993399.1 DNA-formamidopyrimidine glycosylase [Bacillota bacterium]